MTLILGPRDFEEITASGWFTDMFFAAGEVVLVTRNYFREGRRMKYTVEYNFHWKFFLEVAR